jgi:hypothetical protein
MDSNLPPNQSMRSPFPSTTNFSYTPQELLNLLRHGTTPRPEKASIGTQTEPELSSPENSSMCSLPVTPLDMSGQTSALYTPLGSDLPPWTDSDTNSISNLPLTPDPFWMSNLSSFQPSRGSTVPPIIEDIDGEIPNLNEGAGTRELKPMRLLSPNPVALQPRKRYTASMVDTDS